MTRKKEIEKKKSKIKQNKKSDKNFKIILGVIAAAVVAVAIYTTVFSEDNEILDKQADAKGVSQGISNTKNEIEVNKDSVDEKGNLVIDTSDIGEKPKFYSYNELGNEMQVIAVKASDGTIRTAFNTCQVCYSSGRGYYEPVGDILICQNCKNKFGYDDVEVTRGGCNPVPILKEDKTVDGSFITIEKAFFEESEVIFENWK